MINCVYGKIMETLRKIINFLLVNNETDLLKSTTRSAHITHITFGKSYAATHEIKPVSKLSKPIYIGFTALESSKWFMYDFHYNFTKKHFGAELLVTDTDSLTYEIKSDNVFEQFFKHKYLFSNFPKNSKLFDKANKNVIGKIKDVSEQKKSDEFVGLKSKKYSIKNIDGKETNKPEGVGVATEFKEFIDTFSTRK